MNYQFARLEYQHRKLRKIKEGIYPEFGGNVEFELFSFFEICYHLKDWIKESAEYEQASDVEKYIKNSQALRISADICNRLKHKVLRDSKKKYEVTHKRSNAPLGPFDLHLIVDVGPNDRDAKATLAKATIKTERGEECCFQLAQECMEEWDRYFNGGRSNDQHT
ncbi:hypothetical protein [Vreelandella sp. V005]|uniref:hypothetical protein n=1 Tax=Vreelandella sp. V005 TaxID=3459608 RepID=UPI004044AC1E